MERLRRGERVSVQSIEEPSDRVRVTPIEIDEALLEKDLTRRDPDDSAGSGVDSDVGAPSGLLLEVSVPYMDNVAEEVPVPRIVGHGAHVVETVSVADPRELVTVEPHAALARVEHRRGMERSVSAPVVVDVVSVPASEPLAAKRAEDLFAEDASLALLEGSDEIVDVLVEGTQRHAAVERLRRLSPKVDDGSRDEIGVRRRPVLTASDESTPKAFALDDRSLEQSLEVFGSLATSKCVQGGRLGERAATRYAEEPAEKNAERGDGPRRAYRGEESMHIRWRRRSRGGRIQRSKA